MYTAKITNKTLDKKARQFILDVEFTDGTDTFTDTLRFGANFAFEAIKANLKERLDLLNAGVSGEADIEVGDVDVSTVPDTTPTPAEKNASAWLRNFGRLENVQKLIDLGVLTGNETPVKNLKTKVGADFKASYINLL